MKAIAVPGCMAHHAAMARRPIKDWLIVAEAVLWLAVARVRLAVTPFPKLARRLSVPNPRPSHHDHGAVAARIGWAVGAAARRGPVPAVCFPQALAARAMLLRRGLPATLYYGIANDVAGLKAHVWVRSDEVDVVGIEAAAAHRLVATFPPSDASS